jgi:tRNA pseudouridine38-40 synthase
VTVRYFKAIVEYEGTDFAGFQWQHETRTVQGELERAILVRTGQTIRLSGAGRTDAGVHALGQVVSFGVETRIPLDRMALALNKTLPPDVTIRSVTEVDPGFDARFSASSRIYSYLILNRRVPSALWRRYSAPCLEPLAVDRMREAAHLLLGEQDFRAFANQHDPAKVSKRDVMRLNVGRYRDFVIVRIEANAFVRGMVRNIVGTLMEVGTGKRAPDDIPAIIKSQDRRQAGFSAPAQGLCLLRVRYEERKEYARHRRVADPALERGEETTGEKL